MTMYTASGKLIQPGDFFAARVHGPVGAGIRLGEEVVKSIEGWKLRHSSLDLDFEHAGTYVGEAPMWYPASSEFYKPGRDLILEAEPGGAVLRPFHIEPTDCIWSTDNPKLNLGILQRDKIPGIAWDLKGTPYSAADYFAIAAIELRLYPLAWGLKDYVESSKHEICSQLADYVRQLLQFKLFNDERWNGLVDPMDMARCILEGPIQGR